MTRYAWGKAVDDFSNCEHPAYNPSNLLLIDEVEVRDVDFVDTETLEYRVIIRNEAGEFILHGNDDVLREMRKADRTLEITLGES